jgi:hypothetical protein
VCGVVPLSTIVLVEETGENHRPVARANSMIYIYESIKSKCDKDMQKPSFSQRENA